MEDEHHMMLSVVLMCTGAGWTAVDFHPVNLLQGHMDNNRGQGWKQEGGGRAVGLGWGGEKRQKTVLEQ